MSFPTNRTASELCPPCPYSATVSVVDRVRLPLADLLAAMYAEGQTYRQIAARYGVNEATVRRRIDQAGLLQSRSNGPEPARVADARIVELRDRGQSWRVIADTVGLSISGVRRRYLNVKGSD